MWTGWESPTCGFLAPQSQPDEQRRLLVPDRRAPTQPSCHEGPFWLLACKTITDSVCRESLDFRDKGPPNGIPPFFSPCRGCRDSRGFRDVFRNSPLRLPRVENGTW